MLRESLFEGLEPQARRPIINLFGDTRWTYLGQETNQEDALSLPIVRDNDWIPFEFVKAYAMLAMNAGQKSGVREISRTSLLLLLIAYFSPSWVLPIHMILFLFGVFISQRSYKKALALADQFYDRTIYRYEGGRIFRGSDVVKRVIKVS